MEVGTRKIFRSWKIFKGRPSRQLPKFKFKIINKINPLYIFIVFVVGKEFMHGVGTFV